MEARHLKNKPLVEAILEIRWALQGQANMQVDPHYKILLGRLFDRLSSEYKKHQPLPTASIPDEMAGYMVQHQFRVRENDWPLVQVGPGVITLNETSAYTWDDFKSRANQVVSELYAAYPDRDSLRVNSLMLRYINAIEFDYEKEDLVNFLREKMKVVSALPETLFASEKISRTPIGFNWQAMYPIKDPNGVVQMKYATGKKAEAHALIFELLVQTAGQDVPPMPQGFEVWSEKAHEIIEDWFFKLIEGELERRFV
jgi:uncharacterized protein (TIGR04255 family)